MKGGWIAKGFSSWSVGLVKKNLKDLKSLLTFSVTLNWMWNRRELRRHNVSNEMTKKDHSPWRSLERTEKREWAYGAVDIVRGQE